MNDTPREKYDILCWFCHTPISGKQFPLRPASVAFCNKKCLKSYLHTLDWTEDKIHEVQEGYLNLEAMIFSHLGSVLSITEKQEGCWYCPVHQHVDSFSESVGFKKYREKVLCTVTAGSEG